MMEVINLDDYITCKLSRETFKYMLNEIFDMDQAIDKLEDLGFCSDDNALFGAMDAMVLTLDKILDSDTVSWSCFERDFGRDVHQDDISDDDGSTYDVTTVDKLFDYLKESHNGNS